MEGDARVQKGAAVGGIGHNSEQEREERRANLYHSKKDRVFVRGIQGCETQEGGAARPRLPVRSGERCERARYSFVTMKQEPLPNGPVSQMPACTSS